MFTLPMDILPSSTIHARIHARHDAPSYLHDTSLQYWNHSQDGHTHSVTFTYYDENTGEYMDKTFDGLTWS